MPVLDGSVHFYNQIHTGLDPQHTAVQRQVAVAHVAPLTVRIKSVISSPALVLVLQPLQRRFLRLSVESDNALRPLVQIRMYENLQAVGDVYKRQLPQHDEGRWAGLHPAHHPHSGNGGRGMRTVLRTADSLLLVNAADRKSVV